MSRGLIPRAIVQEILEIARHRGDFILFPTGELYDCSDLEPEGSVSPGIPAGRTGIRYYHVGVSTRPVRRELLPAFTWIARTRPEPASRYDLTGGLGSGRKP